jgi:hypothetical protein
VKDFLHTVRSNALQAFERRFENHRESTLRSVSPIWRRRHPRTRRQADRLAVLVGVGHSRMKRGRFAPIYNRKLLGLTARYRFRPKLVGYIEQRARVRRSGVSVTCRKTSPSAYASATSTILNAQSATGSTASPARTGTPIPPGPHLSEHLAEEKPYFIALSPRPSTSPSPLSTAASRARASYRSAPLSRRLTICAGVAPACPCQSRVDFSGVPSNRRLKFAQDSSFVFRKQKALTSHRSHEGQG